MKRAFKAAAAVVLVLAFLFVETYAAPVKAEKEEETRSYSNEITPVKEEVVYGVLENDGNIKNAYIVNVFNVQQSGRIADTGKYSSVKNLTDTGSLELSNEGVSFSSDKGRFYYQGDMSEPELPWKICVTYYLDGRQISPADIAGKTGSLKIDIGIKKNESVNSVFFENYMLQISVLLDAQKCTAITAEGAMIANSGSNKQINFTSMPGTEKTYSLSTEVEDFEMSGITIAGVPMSFEFDAPDTAEFTGELSELTDAITMINDGTSELAEGIGSLGSGAGKLKAGSGEFAGGINSLSAGGAELVSGSSKIQNGLNSLSAMLSGMDTSSISAVSALPAALNSTASALDGMAAELEKTAGGLVSVHASLTGMITALPDYNIDLQALPEGTSPELIEAYSAQKAAIDALKGAYIMQGGISDSLSGIENGISAMAKGLSGDARSVSAGIKAMADGIEQALGGRDIAADLDNLKTGVGALASEYGSFHGGLTAYTGGVSGMAEGYASINAGISGLADGIDKLENGASELSGGTDELEKQTSGMDVKLQDEVDKLISDYTGGDFELMSFASPANKNINSVQFVITTEGVEKIKAEPAVEEQKTETFWDKLVGLFT